MIQILLCCVFVTLVSGQSETPVFYKSMHQQEVSENTPIGTTVYTLFANVSSGRTIRYELQADNFAAGSRSGNVILLKELDYEKNKKITAVVTASCDPCTASTTPCITCTPTTVNSVINIQDENDNTPIFTETKFLVFVSEDEQVGTNILNLVNVTDVDKTNAELVVNCNDTIAKAGLFPEVCDKFQLVQTLFSNVEWNGRIILAEPLDYEFREAYQMPLTAFDGLHYVTQSVEIKVINIQDTPPYFIRAETIVRNEEVPAFTILDYVLAVDGDPDISRPIRYEIVGSTDGLFSIDPVSGNITNNVLLDYEDPRLDNGNYEILVKAREVINQTTGELGDDALTTVTKKIEISIEDQNDNAPIINPVFFNVSINEDILNRTPLPNVNLDILDRDSTNFATFTVRLDPFSAVFEVSPNTSSESSSAIIVVKDTSLINYETGPRRYDLKVIATDVLDNSLFSTASVIVNILDVNDNIPVFGQPSYNTSVSEDATPGTFLIQVQATDPDSGVFGTEGIRYGLIGDGTNLFTINAATGIITVADCTRTITNPCIDYETKRRYDLSVTARDNIDQGYTVTVDLVIHVLDVNDNAPVFKIPDYTSYIRELTTVPDPQVIVEATDPDVISGSISYSILTDPTGLWQVNSVTGNVTANTPIVLARGDLGYYLITVQATDGENSATANVNITVIDVNDNAPIFEQNTYIEKIPEDTPGNQDVLTVKANDNDSNKTGAGVVSYAIDVGADGKFVIDSSTGLIKTSPDASFDYDVVNRYTMSVIARDGGNPKQEGTCTVIIEIIDENNKDPFFVPTLQETDIYENVAVGTSIYTVTARDPDELAVLNYEFDPDSSSAYNLRGVAIVRSDYDFTTLFEIERTTGIVRVASPLNRDQTPLVFMGMKVIDITANPLQTGTGTLKINIKEYNTDRPQFVDVRNVTIDEEQPRGTFVMTLLAIDTDDTISEYVLTYNPYNFFNIGLQTGIITFQNRIDYEQIKTTNFTVMVWDNGQPRLNNSATVYVTIRNINDMSPQFEQTYYKATIPENSPSNTYVTQVMALDQDEGDYGVVRYRLDNYQNVFYVNNVTGEIFTQPGAVLDRETIEAYDLQVTAYDSPLDASVRRFTPITVYVTLSDINDNEPKFSLPDYQATISETRPPESLVLEVSATDADMGINSAIYYTKVPNSGDPQGLFYIEKATGKIFVAKSLLQNFGEYKFQVEARDQNGTGPYANTASVTIIVVEAVNSPPIWVIPDRENYTVDVLEEQYLGLLEFKVYAKDNDRNDNGIVDYFFIVGGQIVSETPEFIINRLTGVISANMVYDRERVDQYLLLLAARDNGEQQLVSTRYLIIKILDVNDHVPSFPIGSNGETRDYVFTVPENAPIGLLVGTVEATDADLAEYAKIYYYIISGNERGMFKLNVTTGQLTVVQTLDSEVQNSFSIDVQATNNISDYSVIRTRQKRALDPSIVTVKITIGNTNDNPPLFTTVRYHGCISTSSSLGQSIMSVVATDQDTAESLVYGIKSGNTDSALAIDSTTGIISSRLLMDRFSGQTFDMVVTADDGQLTAEAQALVFVTNPASEVKVVIAQPASEVRLIVQTIKNTLQGFNDVNGNPVFNYVCTSGIVDHVLEDGDTTKLWSDMYISAICANCNNKNYHIYSGTDLLAALRNQRDLYPDIFNLLYIKDMLLATDETEYFDKTPTLAVMIIVIVLIVLALLLLLIACCCIRKQKKEKQKLLEHRVMTERRGYEPSFVAADVSKNYNPMYDNQAFVPEEPRESLYAKVGKVKAPAPDRAPQPIPQPTIIMAEEEIEVEIRDEDDGPPPSQRSSIQEPTVTQEVTEEYRIETEVL